MRSGSRNVIRSERHTDNLHLIPTLLIEADRRLHQCGDAVEVFLLRHLRGIDHDRQTDAGDLWLLMDQSADGLADFIVGGFLPLVVLCAWPAVVRGRCVGQIILYRYGGSGLGRFALIRHALLAARDLPVWVVTFLGLVNVVEVHLD